MEENTGSFKSFINFIKIGGAIVLVLFLFSPKGSVLMNDIIAALNGNDGIDNPYIKMVKEQRPFNGDSYMAAFTRCFDDNEWTYFKTENGQRIVQIVSTCNDVLDDEMITQIAVTPTNERNKFFIEPYAMRVSGYDLTEYEMNIVLAGIFKNDVVNALEELFLSSLFYQ